MPISCIIGLVIYCNTNAAYLRHKQRFSSCVNTLEFKFYHEVVFQMLGICVYLVHLSALTLLIALILKGQWSCGLL